MVLENLYFAKLELASFMDMSFALAFKIVEASPSFMDRILRFKNC